MKFKSLKKFKLLIAINLIVLLSLSACGDLVTSSSSSAINTSINSSVQETEVNNNPQLSLIAIEVNKLPSKLTYTPNEVISTQGGELRLTFSDYSVKYVPMNDQMIDQTRLNISTLGEKSITLKYTYDGISKYVSYNINVNSFVVSLNSVKLDIETSDVLRDQKVKLNPIFEPANALINEIKWVSSNPLIARVDANGLVTPVNPGRVDITVIVNNTFKASSRLKILDDGSSRNDEQTINLAIDELTLSVSSLGAINTTATNQQGIIKYLISSTSKANELQTLTNEMEEAQANSTLNGSLGSLPSITHLDQNNYLIAVEFLNDKVIAANQTLISLGSVAALPNLAVAFNGNISGNTATTGNTLYYYVNNTSLETSLRSTINLLTPSSEVANTLGALVSQAPTLDVNQHLKYLLVFEINNTTSKVVALEEVLINISNLNNLNLSLSYNNDVGTLNVTNLANNANTLKYVMSTTDHFVNLNNLTASSTITDINNQLGSDNLVSSLPAIGRIDNLKHIMVVEHDANNLVKSIGTVQIVYDIHNLTINNSGLINVSAQHGGTLSFYVAQTSKQATIDIWSTMTSTSSAIATLNQVTTKNNTSELTYTDLGLTLVVIESLNSKVIAAGEATIQVVNVVELTASVSGTGVKSVTKSQVSGTTIKYGLINSLIGSGSTSSWNTNTTETNINTALVSATGRVVTLNTTLDIVSTDHNKYLFIAELNGSNKLVGYKQVLIQLNDISDIATLTANGSITGDTFGSGTKYYFIKTTSQAATIDAWNVLTPSSEVVSALGALTTTSTPSVNISNHRQFAVLVVIENSKVIAADEAEILIPQINTLTPTINYSNGVISVGGTSGGTLKYLISNTDYFAQACACTPDSTLTDFETRVSPNVLVNSETVVEADNGLYLLVGEVNSSTNRMMGVGQIQIIYDIRNISLSLSSLGVLTNSTTVVGTYKYYIADNSKQTEIDSWNQLTTESAAINQLQSGASFASSLATLTYDQVGKYVVVVDVVTNNSVNYIKAASQVQVVSTDIYSLNISVNSDRSIQGASALKSGTIKYGIVNSSVQTSQIDTWNTSTLESSINTALGITLSSSTTVSYTDNSKYLVAVEIKDGKVVSADETQITFSDITELSLTNSNGVISGDTKTNVNSTLKYVKYTSSKQSVIDTFNVSVTEAEAVTDLGGTALTSIEPTYDSSSTGHYVIVLEILNSRVIAAGQTQLSFGTVLTSLSAYNYGGTTSWLDEGSNNNNGTLNGVSYLNNSFIFDGTDDYVQLPNNFINVASDSFTISIWFKPYNHGVILGQVGATSGYVPAIYIGTDNRLRVSTFWFNDTTKLLDLGTINYHSWYQLVVTYNQTGGVLSAYLNGNTTAAASISGATQVGYNSVYNYFLGRGIWGGWAGGAASGVSTYSYFSGEINRFFVSKTIFSTSDITTEFSTYRQMAQLRQSNLDVLPNGGLKGYVNIGTSVKKHVITDEPKVDIIKKWDGFTTEAEANLSLGLTLIDLPNSAISSSNNGKFITTVDIIGGRLVTVDHEIIGLVDRTNLAIEIMASFANTSTVNNTAISGSYNGTLTNGTVLNQTNNYSYFDFDGTNDYISIDASALNEGNNLTVEAWVNRDAKAGGQVILGQFSVGGASSNIAYAIRYSDAAGLSFQINNGSSSAEVTPMSPVIALPANKWTHIVGVFNSSNQFLGLYIDGKLAASKTTAITTIQNLSLPLYLGSYMNNEYPQNFDGKIGEFRLYQRALTQNNILANYISTRSKYINETVYEQLNGEVFLLDAKDYSGFGTWLDQSPNNYQTSFVGAPAFENFSKSFTFNSSNQYLIVNKDLDLANFTLSSWVKMSTLPSSGQIYSIISDERPDVFGRNWNYRLNITSNGYLSGDVSDATNQYIVTDNLNIVDGKWHYVTFIRNTVTDTLELYVDGIFRTSVTDNSTSATSIFENNNQVIWIGKSAVTGNPVGSLPNGSYQFNGNIGYVSIHNRALTAAEVYRSYLSSNRFDDRNLLVFLDAGNSLSYPGSGSSWNDLSVNQNNATSLTGVTFTSTDSNLNGALDFDGSSGSGTIDKNKLNQVFYGKTILVTAKLDNAMARDRFRALLGTDSTRNFNLYLSTTNTGTSTFYNFHFSSQAGSTQYGNFSKPFELQANQWFSVAVTHDLNGVVNYYLNGILLGNADGFNGQNFEFGQYNLPAGTEYIGRSNEYWDGPISSVAIYREVLRLDEIKKYHQEYLSNKLPALNLDAGNTLSYSGSGTTWIDLSDNYNATLVNGPTYSPTNSGVIDFDGSNDYVTTNYSFSNNRIFSISAWVNFDNLTGWQTIVGQDSSDNTIYGIFYFQKSMTDNFFQFNMTTNTGVQVVVSDPVPVIANTWYHYTVTVSPTVIILYKNGVQVASRTNLAGADLIATPTGTAVIGAGYWQNGIVDQFNGKLGQVKIFETTLSPSVVEHEYSLLRNRYHPITNNLVLNLDASNKGSYIGSGTSWINLVNKTSYTMTNTTFNSNNGGAINFGGDAYVELGSILPLGTNYTKEAWVYDNVGAAGNRNILSTANDPLFISGSTLYAGVGTEYLEVSSTSFPQGVWRHVVASFNDTTNTMVLYINGVEVSRNSNATTSYSGAILRIGSHFTSTVSSFWNGQISEVRVYNQELTLQQILHNFNATKARFGIS